MKIGVLGAGAFGTALAISLSQSAQVTLWARDPDHAADMRLHRQNRARLPDIALPDDVVIADDLSTIGPADVLLVAIPMQKLRSFLREHQDSLKDKVLVACCKGIELGTGLGPPEIIAETCPDARSAILTGPSFAQDIARGLPTALTLACADPTLGADIQTGLSNATLRLYRTTDVVGASLGGALKNVIAIASGAAIGAKLGESARAALMTRGNAEMTRFAQLKGARPETLAGLSGFGDLVLTCTSPLSRNYRFGLSIGSGEAFDTALTVEGAATAQAVAAHAGDAGVDMPIATTVAALVEKRLDINEAMTALLSRALKEE